MYSLYEGLRQHLGGITWDGFMESSDPGEPVMEEKQHESGRADQTEGLIESESIVVTGGREYSRN